MDDTLGSHTVYCLVCGEQVEEPDIQLCNRDECMEQFSDIYLQVC